MSSDLIVRTCGSVTPVDSYVEIGGYWVAADPGIVKARKYTHILKLFPDDKTYYGGYHRHPGVQYLVIDADDVHNFPLDKHFPKCLAFIQDVVRKKGKVLVHCHAGVSRSSTIVLLYLMVVYGFTLEKALKFLRVKRPVVNPNPGFLQLLGEVDKQLHGFYK